MNVFSRLLLRVALSASMLFALTVRAAPVSGFTELLHSKASYKKTWAQMFNGEKNVPGWALKASGISPPYSMVRTASGDAIYGEICKPHDCFNNRFYATFSPDRRKVWGLLVIVRDTPEAIQNPKRFAHYRWFGKPDTAVQKLLTEQLEADPDWK